MAFLKDNTDIISKHIRMYNRITGIPCFVIDEQGETMLAEGDIPQYCAKFHQIAGGGGICNDAHINGCRESEKIGEPYIFFCPGGLTHWSAPVIINGVFRCALVGGPVQMNFPDEYTIDEVMHKGNFEIQNRGILQSYIKMIPVVDPEKVRYLSEMLFMLARDIMTEESRILSDRKKFYQEQAAINEEIQFIKQGEQKKHISAYYHVELENELVSRVKRGDKKGAKTILNELLGYVLFTNGNNYEVTKARVLELMIVLSRAAVEGGANLEMIFGLKLKYLQEISSIDGVESLCQWIIKVIERFTDCIFTVENQNNSYVLQKAVEFISENYMNDISLESISDYVYLSTSYFSRLFKREMGINFIDYLNKVRVEESKKYLSDLKVPLSDIAHSVGFTDQSYFTKVFKKIEGMSPGQFRKLA